LDAVLAVLLRGEANGPTPEWATGAATQTISRLVAPLTDATATVADAVRVAEALAGAIAAVEPTYAESDRELDGFMLDRLTGDALLDMYIEDEAPAPGDATAPRVDTPGQQGSPPDGPEQLPLELSQDADDGRGGAQ